MIDLRHASVAALYDLGWTRDRVCAALELDAATHDTLTLRADVLDALRSIVCSRCGRRVRAATSRAALRSAFTSGWDHTTTGHLRCSSCLKRRSVYVE